MVKIKYSSSVKVLVNNDGKTSTQLIYNDKKDNEAWTPNQPKKLKQQLDIEKHLSDLTDHFDSKLESLHNLILTELTEKINKIEKSVQNIGQLHEALLEKIGNLERIVSQMKNEKDINVQMQEIKDLKQQISLLQAKVSAIQEQKLLLISRMNDFDVMKQHIHEMDKQTYGEFKNHQTFEIQKVMKTEELAVYLMSKLATSNLNATQDLKNIDRVPHRTKKRGLSKNVIVRFKLMHLKNKFLRAARMVRFKQHKGQSV